MKHFSFRLTQVAITALAVALAATGSSSGSEQSAAAVDESELDWGNYQIVPRDMTASATAASGAAQESVRLADYVPLPLEVDPRLTVAQRAHPVTAEYPPAVKGFADGPPGLVAGWHTSARQRAADSGGSLALSMEHNIARFDSHEHAEQAMNILAADVDPDYPIQGPLTVPGYDSARAVLNSFDSVQVWLVHDDYLIWLWLSDLIAAPEGPGPLLELAKRFLDRQLELLPGYQPTPLDRIATVTADIDGLRGRTLPDDADQIWPVRAIYRPHAALHGQTDPARSQRAFSDSGVDLVAVEYATLYRTSDPAKARGLAANFADELTANYAPIDAPPGLPAARCLHAEDENKASVTARYVCYLAYDRYVAEVYARQPQDLNQRVSAQYKLLAHGQ